MSRENVVPSCARCSRPGIAVTSARPSGRIPMSSAWSPTDSRRGPGGAWPGWQRPSATSSAAGRTTGPSPMNTASLTTSACWCSPTQPDTARPAALRSARFPPPKLQSCSTSATARSRSSSSTMTATGAYRPRPLPRDRSWRVDHVAAERGGHAHLDRGVQPCRYGDVACRDASGLRVPNLGDLSWH
jgi:hypothetical protein